MLLLVLYLAALVVWPYAGFLILSIIIAYTARPLYQWFERRINHPTLTASLMVFLTIIVLFLPSIFLVKALIQQSVDTLSNVDSAMLEEVSIFAYERFGIEMDISYVFKTITTRVRDFLISEGLSVLSSFADMIIGLLIMFFSLFYLFRDGDKIYNDFIHTLPLQKSHKHVLFGQIEIVTNAVIYGQLIIALIQGLMGGLAYWLFGLSNPVFWGFVLAVISFLPVLGTPIVLIPTAIIQLLHGNYFAGIGLIVFTILMIMNIDSVFKPLIISNKSRLNAALILIGVIGGLKAFGFMGFILGPLVLALLIALLQVFREDFRPSAELAQANKDQLVVKLRPRPVDAHRNNVVEEKAASPELFSGIKSRFFSSKKDEGNDSEIVSDKDGSLSKNVKNNL